MSTHTLLGFMGLYNIIIGNFDNFFLSLNSTIKKLLIITSYSNSIHKSNFHILIVFRNPKFF